MKDQSVRADHLKAWPKQGWDPDIDIQMEENNDKPYTPSLEGDADVNIAECGIVSEDAIC